MQRQPKNLSPITYTVVLGDNLWDIASRRLNTQDPQLIASYWVRIYRHNRHVIGRDPNLLHPGQRLRLPEA